MTAKEQAIRLLVSKAIDDFSFNFAAKHIAQAHNPDGAINLKINNIFIACLGDEIRYYTSLTRSLDSSLGNMLEDLACAISKLNYIFNSYVLGPIRLEQLRYISSILDNYKSRSSIPRIEDYLEYNNKEIDTRDIIIRKHISDYYLYDKDLDEHYVIELKLGGDLDNKKSRSEKEALLEQYFILRNCLNEQYRPEKIRIFLATAYNKSGEGNYWQQERVRQFFAEDELLIGSKFWNFICKDDNGFKVIIDQYKKDAWKIIQALKEIKEYYLHAK